MVNKPFRLISKMIFFSGALAMAVLAGAGFIGLTKVASLVPWKTVAGEGFAIFWLMVASMFFASMAGEVLAAEKLKKSLDLLKLKVEGKDCFIPAVPVTPKLVEEAEVVLEPANDPV